MARAAVKSAVIANAAPAGAMGSSEPSADCPLCPRLKDFRDEWRLNEPSWFNAPVPGFGPITARLLIVGLAPGLRGANRTGRPFTGDYAGDLLYATLLDFGFARGRYEARPDDGLELEDARIINAVRCVPPQNKPTPEEIRTCRRFLSPTFSHMPHLKAVVTLGKIAHDSTLAALGAKASHLKFGHGAKGEIGGVRVFASYHCSRYNTNTGVLTPAMFRTVFQDVRDFLAD
ncbi:uracil-DNA glycosylase [Xanthobacter variabilis]|uniref:uracil-DNA glycosylase n=1 Tax=Xanthobacter variabilis TaxID=3119932 RepID=UPI00372D58B5